MMQAARDIRSPLLTRQQAADYLTLSLRQFDRLSATIPHVVVGKRGKRYFERDLVAWLEQQRSLGRSTAKRARTTSASTSPTQDEGTENPRAAQILARLRSKQRASTPRLYPVANDV
jgi:hypothetical protein